MEACALQGRELEVFPRLEELVCMGNAPDNDDQPMLTAPVGLLKCLPRTGTIVGRVAMPREGMHKR